MPRDLSHLFAPASIAIIGASRSAEKVGAITLKNIIDSGYQGKIFPVNPNETELAGLKCYPHINDIEIVPELAVIATPAGTVAEILTTASNRGVKNFVIFTAGYKEAGIEGEVLETQLKDIADKYQLNIIGPNCLGFANNELPLNVTFGQIVKQMGNLRIISQSGALATSLFDWCETVNLGFSQFITVGNKTVINENDILKYWSQHPVPSSKNQDGISSVSPIGLYLESISNGVEFISLAKDISRSHPMFILKPGKSRAAAKAMHSHTGSIAGEDSVLEVALKEAGIIRCQELGEFFDLARTLAWENAPTGPRVAVISNAGGPAVLSTDSLTAAGLELADFSSSTHQKLSDNLPRMAGLLNPVDVLGDALADRFGTALDFVLQENSVDSVIVILTPQLMTQIEKTATTIGNLSKKYSKPILCSFIGGGTTTVGESVLNSFKIPSFPFPERAIKTLSYMWQWQNWKNQQSSLQDTQSSNFPIDTVRIKSLLDHAASESRKSLNNIESNDIVSLAGINTPQTATVTNLSEAINFTSSSHWPIVLKVSSPKLLHKTEVGGVITGINDQNMLTAAWDQLSQKIDLLSEEIVNTTTIQVQRQISSGIEVIVGIKRDPTFGAVLLFGAGGKFAELISDRNLHLLPLNMLSVQKLVSESKVFKILNGYRSEEPYKLESLYELIIKMSKLMENFPQISDIEINPVIINHSEISAVDTKVILV